MSTASSPAETGRRLAAVSVVASTALAVANITTGLLSRSTAVTAAGLEFAGDVLASLIVFFGMLMASRPPDEDHPYGHGRFEILAGLLVGMLLVLAGGAICYHSLEALAQHGPQPAAAAIWAPVVSILVKGGLAFSKFRVGRRIGSAALIADAWNDSVDIISALVALGALFLTLSDSARFSSADQYGGLAVGVMVIVTGLRVVRDASLELTDTMPAPRMLADIRRHAFEIEGVEGVEKCFARKTGLQYHVDLHIEVNPQLTVAESHYLAHKVQKHVIRHVPFVAGVLVHIEPAPSVRADENRSR